MAGIREAICVVCEQKFSHSKIKWVPSFCSVKCAAVWADKTADKGQQLDPGVNPGLVASKIPDRDVP